MKISGLSSIAGKSGATGGATFRAIAPSSGEHLAPDFHEASGEEVDRAMQASAAAFAEYREAAPESRAQFLEMIAAGTEDLGDELVQRAHAETGLPMPRL